MSHRWHIITGEYPPQLGGVADYSRSVARALAEAGDEVFVWASQCGLTQFHDEGVMVRRLPGHFGPVALATLDAALCRLPGRVLLQYTPHAFGYKAMNLPLCLWLWKRRPKLDVMFHEVAFPFEPGQPLKHSFLAAVQRGMASLLLRAAERVFVSIPGWGSILKKLAPDFPTPVWTPVPSNLGTDATQEGPTALSGHESQAPLVGHFGTYGPTITRLLEPALTDLLKARPDVRVLLLGRGGPDFAKRLPCGADRIVAPGELDATAVGDSIARCDVMLQPYPDGISSRRTSAMASLALGRPVVTTEGELSEPLWREMNAVVLARPHDLAGAVVALLDDARRRLDLGQRAAALYKARFTIDHTIRALRDLPVGDEGTELPGALYRTACC